MNNLLFKVFSIALILSFTSTIVQAQQPGKRGGNAANFFATDAFGGQNAHLQQGAFGSFGLNDRWIGIGQPAIGGPAELYGMRVQDRGFTGTFSLNGSQDFKNLEIDWGGADKSKLNFNFIETPFSKYLVTSIDQKGGVRTIGRFQAYNGPGGTSKFIEIFYSGSTARLNANKAEFLDFQHNNSTKMRLTESGTLGINILAPDTNFKLDVSGKTRCTLGVWSASDKRYKEDISELSEVSEKLAQLKGVSYRFKNEVINGVDFTQQDERRDIGFIAQDLAKVFPDLVTKDNAGYYSVRYEGLIPVLVEGFNDQQQEIEEQGELINEQTNLINEQTKLINTQESTILALTNKMENMEQQLSAVLTALQNLDAEAALNITPGTSESALDQNRPNPFKGQTIIDYTLPLNATNASLSVFNIEGKMIKSFELNDRQGSVNFDGSNLSAGTYFYALNANGKKLAQQKMVIQ